MLNVATLEIGRGGVVGSTGEHGSGQSTLIRTLAWHPCVRAGEVCRSGGAIMSLESGSEYGDSVQRTDTRRPIPATVMTVPKTNDAAPDLN